MSSLSGDSYDPFDSEVLPNGLLNAGEPTQLCLRSPLLKIPPSPINPRFKKKKKKQSGKATLGPALERGINRHDVIALPPWKRPARPPSEQGTPGPSVAENQFPLSDATCASPVIRAPTVTPGGEAPRARVSQQLPGCVGRGSVISVEPSDEGQSPGAPRGDAKKRAPPSRGGGRALPHEVTCRHERSDVTCRHERSR